MSANQTLTVRIAVIDGEKARRDLVLIGKEGRDALRLIEEATKPATRQLLAVNVVGEQLRYGMQNLAGSAGTLGLSLMRLGPLGLAAAAAIGTLGLATSAGLREFKEAEQAINQLNAALKATDSASGVTTGQVLELGEAIERNTLFKKEEVLKAASALTTFGNIQGDVFKRALALSTDLAVRLGTDVPSAAEMLGKALEEPEEGLGKLARRFTDLTPLQKDAIANFIKQGDVAAAQAVILDHLQGKVRGLAEGQAQGLTGAANKLSDAWDNLLESLGRTVSESGTAQASLAALTFIVEKLNNALDNSPKNRKRQLEQEISELSGSFGTRVDEYFLGSAPVLEEKKRELQKINDELAAEQRKADEEAQKAQESAEKSAAGHRYGELLELQKKYLKESADLTLTAQQKVLKEAAERREHILALNKKGDNNEATQKALAALDASTASKLAEANKGAVDSALDRRKRAIEEINRSLLQTKPSFDVAKQALDDWKNNLIENLGGATEANQKYIELIEQIYTVKLKEIYNKSLLDSKKWEDGVSRALRRYADDATNAAKNAEELFGTAARKVEDTLVDMVSTGEFSFKKLGDLVMSIEQDILRMFIRENITGPIAGGLSDLLKGSGSGGGSGGGFLGGFFDDLFGSLFHDGGIVGMSRVARRAVPAHAFIGAPRLHNGLMPDEFPAILQRGETVLPKNSKMGGMNVTFNISTPNAQSFMDSQGQIMSRLAGQMARFKARNG